MVPQGVVAGFRIARRFMVFSVCADKKAAESV
jgi:hypothetical protein